MSMVLDCNAENPEAVVSDCVALDPGLVLKDVVDRLGEEADEGVPLRCGDEYATELQLQYFAHAVQRCLKLC
jgi:hypothetical protein